MQEATTTQETNVEKTVLDIIGEQLRPLTDADLLAGLALVTGQADEERIVRAAIRTELELRYDVDTEMDAWADDLESGLTYDQALRAALRTKGVEA